MNYFAVCFMWFFSAGLIMIFPLSVFADAESDLNKVAINQVTIKKATEQKLVDVFRKSLTEGDWTNCGPVIEVKSKMVKISSAVANYGNEHWLIRNQVFPSGYSCDFVNGEYQPPQLKAALEEDEIRTMAPKANFVSQGGLTWWPDANAYCNNTAISGKSGWRLPTKDELSALYNSGAMKDQGWTLLATWSSTPRRPDVHYFVALNFELVDVGGDSANVWVTCVH
jgi:hypothetical protein